MTTLSDRLVEYLDHRRRFGYRRIGTTAAVLRRFAAFADDFGAESITTELFLEWREQFEAPSDVTWGCNLSHVRGFAKWLHCVDPRTEVPSVDLIRRGNRRPRPYIYTEEELARIVEHAAQLPSPRGLNAWTFSTLFGLIAVTGLRLGEALGLDEADVNLDEGVLTITRTKNSEFRLLPVALSTTERLGAYRAVRDRILGNGAQPFFLKKGRNRFHTDWKEPKLLILYVVGDDGRPSQTWAPIIDGTLRGPEAVFALLLSYARQIGLNAADKVLFIADGAPWIWQRIQRLIAALGLSPTQVLGLIDFYHAAKQLSDAVKLRRWSATQRTRWLNRTRGLLKRARVDEVITALRELCRGRTAGIRTHLNYFLKNRHRFAYTTMVGLGLPQGSGAVESAIRRVINLRIKGASIYWLPESVDAILLLRSFYKSGRWNCLQRMAMTPVGVSA